MTIFDDVADWQAIMGDRMVPMAVLPRVLQASLVAERAACDFAETATMADRFILAQHLVEIAKVIVSDEAFARRRAREAVYDWTDAPSQGCA